MITASVILRVEDDQQCSQAIEWWRTLTESGREDMVVKPLKFIARGKKGLLQPAIKCRGPEYLRIIYGPEYLREANLARLRERHLAAKRSLALKEFSLGVESLQRFVSREPFGVFTNACSVSWHSKANPSTHACKAP